MVILICPREVHARTHIHMTIWGTVLWKDCFVMYSRNMPCPECASCSFTGHPSRARLIEKIEVQVCPFGLCEAKEMSLKFFKVKNQNICFCQPNHTVFLVCVVRIGFLHYCGDRISIFVGVHHFCFHAWPDLNWNCCNCKYLVFLSSCVFVFH